MGSSSPSPPPPPDPAATANAQGQANTSTAAAQAALNYTNQYTPYGSTSYQVTGSYTDPNGQTVPTYSQYTQLSPLSQQLLTGQQGLSNDLLSTGQGLIPGIQNAVSKPLNFNTAQSGILNQTPQYLDSSAASALYGQQKLFLDPQFNQEQRQLQDQLSQQGIPIGSEAYTNAMNQFDTSKNQAYQSAADQAVAGGANAAAQNFGMALQGQQQNIAQQQLAQQNQLGLLGSLLGASPGSPQQPIATPSATQISPTDTIGAQALSTNAAQQQYQSQLAQQNSMFGGLASLGSAGLLALAL